MTEPVLFVDDERMLLESVKRNLRREFNIFTAISGEDGLREIQENGPFAVIVSDMRMPGMNGTDFLTKARQLAPDTVRILLTGQADMNDAVAVVNEGHIFRFLTKPCPPDRLAQAVRDGIEQHHRIVAEKELLEKTLQGSIKLLTEILSITNPEAFKISLHLRKTVHHIAERLNLPKLWEADVAAMLSQIGCVTIPETILRKKMTDQALLPEEEAIFNTHLKTGRDLLNNIPRLENIARAIYYQEKRYNGDGPPADKIRGKEIPLMARILKAAIDYQRLLAGEHPPEEALNKMEQHADWYDPEVLAALKAEVMQIEQGFIVKEIKAVQVEVGMVLADDVKSRVGALLIPRGHEISEVLRNRILNFARTNNLQEPLKVLEWVQVDE